MVVRLWESKIKKFFEKMLPVIERCKWLMKLRYLWDTYHHLSYGKPFHKPLEAAATIFHHDPFLEKK